jgi:UDP-N-acetyl-D-glucosamine/UDP-N-acetyl-D-galactosamine dehydrogenase
VTVQISDPLADPRTVEEEYGVPLLDISELAPSDAIIMAVAHQTYIEGGWPLVQRLLRDGAGLVFDVKMKLDRGSKPSGIELWRL